MEIILATWNEIKVKWLTRGFSHLGMNITPISSNDYEDVEESGSTFAENALIKIRVVGVNNNAIVIGEDSGLSIDALDGFPGVKTVRWLEGTDDDRSIKLLQMMKDVPEENRGASFMSSIALLFPDGAEKIFTGELKGKIATELIGEEGKGYQRIFILSGGKTLAQSYSELVNQDDHRHQAMQMAASFIRSWLDGYSNNDN